MQTAATEYQTALPVSLPLSGILWIKLSVLYMIVGITLGIVMGATENFTLRPVHAHLNLLGWATMAIAGLVYSVFPKLAENRLARIHFWLHNVSLPLMMGSLAFFLTGSAGALPVLVVAQFVMAAAVLVFAANLFLNLKKP
jgi:hypothetical protein